MIQTPEVSIGFQWPVCQWGIHPFPVGGLGLRAQTTLDPTGGFLKPLAARYSTGDIEAETTELLLLVKDTLKLMFTPESLCISFSLHIISCPFVFCQYDVQRLSNHDCGSHNSR
jgi:hypothetical protein